MHCESPDFGLVSPVTSGAASHCMAVDVDDLDAHFARVQAAGGEIAYEPTDMPYGVREYPIEMDDGRIGHVELAIAGARFMMADEFLEAGVGAAGPGAWHGKRPHRGPRRSDADSRRWWPRPE